jgi:RHS repeat-associated protein
MQGDVIELVDINGNSVVKYKYDAWGNIISQTGGSLADINPYRYRGYRFDVETGLYYLQSRYYDPAIGRFISSDGLLGETGNLLTHNMYAYSENNPVMYVDPSGEFALSILIGSIIVGAIIGGLVAYNVAGNNEVEGLDLIGLVALGAVGGGVLGYLAAPFIASFLSASFTFTIPSGIGFTGYGSATLVTSTVTITGSQLALAGGLSSIAGVMFFAKKDIRDVNRAVRQVGVDRDLFGEYIHEVKFQQGMKPDENFTWKQLIDLAKELLKSIRK